MKKTIPLLLAAGLLASCATHAPDVATYIDPVTHARTDLMGENMLPSPEPIREIVWLSASRVFTTAKDFQYYLEVDYMARAETGYLEIPPGDSLVIIADGKQFKFGGSGSINSRKKADDNVSERAIYAATGEQLRSIATADNVKVSILGRNGMVQRTFSPENSERFRQFVQRYVNTAG
jgi:hypothetical protein